MIRALIFTDLDGTLLDDRYDLAGAAQAMDRVAEGGGVVIPVSSKTHAEMELLRARQSVATPFVFENGAGIDWGEDQQWASGLFNLPTGLCLDGSSYKNICDHLSRIREQLDIEFVGFSELSTRQVAALTDLSMQDARLAKLRMASEPISGLCEKDAPLLEKALNRRGLMLQKGGRFYTATIARDKGDAVAEIFSVLRRSNVCPEHVVICGDSPNDLSMLALGDVAVVFSCLPPNEMRRLDDNLHEIYDMKSHFLDAARVPRLVEVYGAGHEYWLKAVMEELYANG